MSKFLVASVALLIPLAACGGSDDTSDDGAAGTTASASTSAAETDATDATSGGADDTPTPTQAPSSDGGSDATTSPPADAGDSGGDAGGSGPSTATVTLGGETYEFSTEGAIVAQCQTDLFGIFSVQLPRLDGDGGIGIVALREGTDPAVVEEVNAVEVSIGDDDWVADEASDLFGMSDQLEPGMSQVDSVEIDGSTVRGSGTFVRQGSIFAGGEVETMTGTFEATCGEERLS